MMRGSSRKCSCFAGGEVVRYLAYSCPVQTCCSTDSMLLTRRREQRPACEALDASGAVIAACWMEVSEQHACLYALRSTRPGDQYFGTSCQVRSRCRSTQHQK